MSEKCFDFQWALSELLMQNGANYACKSISIKCSMLYSVFMCKSQQCRNHCSNESDWPNLYSSTRFGHVLFVNQELRKLSKRTFHIRNLMTCCAIDSGLTTPINKVQRKNGISCNKAIKTWQLIIINKTYVPWCHVDLFVHVGNRQYLRQVNCTAVTSRDSFWTLPSKAFHFYCICSVTHWCLPSRVTKRILSTMCDWYDRRWRVIWSSIRIRLVLI